ncbi:hypothetical protein [Cupriavidus sp. PET2-C1]
MERQKAHFLFFHLNRGKISGSGRGPASIGLQIVIQPIIHQAPAQVEDRLRALGVSEAHLRTAVAAGFAAWAACTPHHPPGAPGYHAWSETVATLRDELAPEGFEPVNDENWPLALHPETQIAIAVSSGDENTGRHNANPATKTGKGPRTIRAVASNRDRQMSLFEFLEDTEPVEVPVDVDGCETWVLLVYRDEFALVVRMELSRPIGLDTDNKVNDWAERIILSDLPFDGDSDVSLIDDGPNSPSGNQFPVDIRKRG